MEQNKEAFKNKQRKYTPEEIQILFDKIVDCDTAFILASVEQGEENNSTVACMGYAEKLLQMIVQTMLKDERVFGLLNNACLIANLKKVADMGGGGIDDFLNKLKKK